MSVCLSAGRALLVPPPIPRLGENAVRMASCFVPRKFLADDGASRARSPYLGRFQFHRKLLLFCETGQNPNLRFTLKTRWCLFADCVHGTSSAVYVSIFSLEASRRSHQADRRREVTHTHTLDAVGPQPTPPRTPLHSSRTCRL